MIKIHQIDSFLVKKTMCMVKMAAMLKKMAAILDFQLANRTDLTSSGTQRTFVPNVMLVSQFTRFIPLSAPLKGHVHIIGGGGISMR